jgi:hypothetical protein
MVKRIKNKTTYLYEETQFNHINFVDIF